MSLPFFSWQSALSLDESLNVTYGSPENLLLRASRGADLRIATSFRHNEHIDTSSDNPDLIEEVMDLRVVYVLENRWVAGVTTLRQPVELPHGFGPRPSMSYFLYNQDANQGIARPYLDGPPVAGTPGPSTLQDHSAMPRYHEFSRFDDGTNAPCSNFRYDFDEYRFLVKDDWYEVLHHDEHGHVLSGSLQDLYRAFRHGMEFKVAIHNLATDLAPPHAAVMSHDVIVQGGAGYFYTGEKRFLLATHPVVRIAPSIPLQYASENWDVGWYLCRTDGYVAGLIYNPRTLVPRRTFTRHALRWLCR